MALSDIVSQKSLDAHAKPPASIRDAYKKYQKMPVAELNIDENIIDFSRGLSAEHRSYLQRVRQLESEDISRTWDEFHQYKLPSADGKLRIPHDNPIPVYEHIGIPGLQIIPTLLPPPTQLTLLTRLLHRDLSNPLHQTNLHTHYTLPYPPPNHSFFTLPSIPTPSTTLTPHDPSVHTPLPLPKALSKTLHWMTLGGQYDWTLKRYPSSPPPPFPADVAALVEALFPAMRAQAAIVNFYSPGDRLSVHRDVSEACARPLVSVSLGCEGVFVVGVEDEAEGGGGGKARTVVLRLRSGDALVMSGRARFAWHGVPQVLAGTCPEYLREWPAAGAEASGEEEEGAEQYEQWRAWMAGKRINLNVRQMWD